MARCEYRSVIASLLKLKTLSEVIVIGFGAYGRTSALNIWKTRGKNHFVHSTRWSKYIGFVAINLYQYIYGNDRNWCIDILCDLFFGLCILEQATALPLRPVYASAGHKYGLTDKRKISSCSEPNLPCISDHIGNIFLSVIIIGSWFASERRTVCSL